ncbi:MAG: flagellar basal body-associated FliL family protein [Desulfovibrionaceae bacterium]|nr:flagellar basal body-associated FliL family protein [Desulfovibrionaceae bacterium]
MAKDKKKALPEGEEAATPTKRSRKKIVIILFLLLLTFTGVGAGGYWWFFLRNPGVVDQENTQVEAEADSKEAEAKHVSEPEKAAGGKNHEEASAKIERPTTLGRASGIVVPLPPITVNLRDASGRRYLKLGMEVQVNKDVSKALKANEARIRDAVIMLLAGKGYEEVASPDGKVMLKAEVANRLNQILGEQRVIRVYFTDFVVQ